MRSSTDGVVITVGALLCTLLFPRCGCCRLGPRGVYGTYHLESFDCFFCGNRQVVKLNR
jgi:hypothetical protein